jgi:DNA-binding CsgD family transcriptional regulator
MKECATTELDTTDYLIAITIDAQNIAHIANDPNTSLRYSQIIEPAWMRRGISRAEVSRITHIAPETVRRRINHLIKKGILEERCDGIVVLVNPNEIASHSGKMRANVELVETLVEELRVRGIAY